MGACMSCLGQRERAPADDNEESRPLYDENNGMHYGSFSDGAMPGDESLETQRENEALQRVVAQTSNNMVDVFDVAPQQPASDSPALSFGNETARAARYQHLVSKLNDEQSEQSAGVKVDWLANGDFSVGSKSGERPLSLKTLDDDDDALVGTFADAAAAAMK